MNARQVALRERRARLIERAAAERVEMGRLMADWEVPLAAVDRCRSAYSTLKRQPALRFGAAVGMAALAFLRPNSILGWVMRGRTFWQMFQRARDLIARPSRREAR